MNPFLQFLLMLLGLRQGGQANAPLSGPVPKPLGRNVFPDERVAPAQSRQTLAEALAAPTQKRLAEPPSGIPGPEGSVIGSGGVPLDPVVFSGFRDEERELQKFAPDPIKNEFESADRDLRPFKSPLGMLREPQRPGGLPANVDFGTPQLSFPTEPFESVGRIGPRGTLENPELEELLGLMNQPRLSADDFGFDRPRVKRRRNEFFL